MNKGLELVVLAALAILPTGSALAAPSDALKIGWNDLRPADAQAGKPTGKTAPVSGEELSWNLQGKTVEIAGYALPSDREGDLVYQFLLIPWTGLCAHVAPPPPNQAVLINLKTPVKLTEAYETVSVTGTLQPELEKTQLFILDGVSVMESGYRIAGAQIAPADTISSGAPRQTQKANPWAFVRK
jgi:hypothetical protein